METVFLGRQPILSSKQVIVGYELLFRDSHENRAVFSDSFQAMSRTMVNVFENFGIDSLLDNALGFINIDEKGLNDDIIELIPKDRFILEILENIQVTDAVVDRVKHLRSLGYHFALDDMIFTTEYLNMFAPLMPLVDYIKVDIKDVDHSTLAQKVKTLKRFPAKLIAEKVENKTEYDFCYEAGFDYFQGYYFARPDILEKKSFEPSQLSVMKIIQMINTDATVNNIADVFSLHPDLSYSLLRFINSAIFFFRDSIKSIKHAINLLGLKKLQNWLFLLSYAKLGGSSTSALMQMAVVRAKTMEHLVLMKSDEKDADSAFLIGMLSLIDTLFNSTKEELMDELNIDDEIREALLESKGRFGCLLKAVVGAEEGHFEDVKSDLSVWDLSLKDFGLAQIHSLVWYKKLMQEMG